MISKQGNGGKITAIKLMICLFTCLGVTRTATRLAYYKQGYHEYKANFANHIAKIITLHSFHIQDDIK